MTDFLTTSEAFLRDVRHHFVSGQLYTRLMQSGVDQETARACVTELSHLVEEVEAILRSLLKLAITPAESDMLLEVYRFAAGMRVVAVAELDIPMARLQNVLMPLLPPVPDGDDAEDSPCEAK